MSAKNQCEDIAETDDYEGGDCHQAGQKSRGDGVKDQRADDGVRPIHHSPRVSISTVSEFLLKSYAHLPTPNRLFHNKMHRNPAIVMSATQMEIKVASIST